MKLLSRLFLKGLMFVLPAVLTVYIFFWLGAFAESGMKTAMREIVGVQYYFPGMGIVVGLGVIILVGVVTEVWIVQRLVWLGESLILRVPLVKTIYGGLKDFMQFVSTASSGKTAGQTVMASIADDVRLMGLVTRKDFFDVPEGIGGENVVAVYLPMSYQLGGFTVYVPRDRVDSVDMSAEDAMSFALTAGITTGGRGAQGAVADQGAEVQDDDKSPAKEETTT